MTIDEVLKYDMTNSSIKKIDFFIGCQIKNSTEYLMAVCYKAQILHVLGKDNDALRLLYGLIPDFKEMNSDKIIIVCDGIIDLCLDLKRYDQVEKYIKVKANNLPVSKSVLNLKDNIKLYLALRKYEDAKVALEKYLHDDITADEANLAKVDLLDIYFTLHDYDSYLTLAKDVEGYYQVNMNYEKANDIGLNILKITFERGNYLRVISDGNNYLTDDVLNTHQKLVAANMVMISYLLNSDYRRAGMVEANYSDLLSVDYIDESIDYIKTAIRLYTETHTLSAVRDYEIMLDSFESSKKVVKKEVKKQKKNQEEIVIPELPKEEALEKFDAPPRTIFNYELEEEKKLDTKVVSKIEKIQNVIVSENYTKLENVFNSISQCNIESKFREIFRQAGIEIEKLFGIKEMYIMYYKRKYIGMHYKTERVYDKKLTFEAIDNTLSFAAMSFEAEMFLSKEDDTYDKNIVTDRKYDDIPYGFAMPIYDELKPIGSIAFFSDNEFLSNEMTYESLKLIVSMLNTRLQISFTQDDIEYQNKKLFFINNNFNRGLKEEIEGYVHFNQKACDILGVIADMRIEDYLINVDSADVSKYKNLKDELYCLELQDQVLEYTYNKNGERIRIRETFYSYLNEGVVSIVSILEDITADEKNKDDLTKLAYTNPVSKLDTALKLTVDLTQIYQKKVLALAIVDIIDFDMYRVLYGYNFTNQLIYTVGQEFKEYFSNIFTFSVYHLERDRYALLFRDINDKRLIESNLKKSFEAVKGALFKLNSRVNLKFNAGVYRLGKGVIVSDASKILNYAYDALDDAKTLTTNENHICHYDSELSKIRFRDNSLITHISEAIDHGNIAVSYRQVVNLSDNSIFAYYAFANLDNYDIDYSYIEYVTKRRNMLPHLEKYIISLVVKELKMLKEEIQGYILAIVNASDETINESFASFMRSQNNFFKISPKFICINVSDASNKVLKELRSDGYKAASSNLADVYNENIDIFFLDSNEISLDAIEEVKDLCKKHNVTCVINNIDSKEDVVIARKEKIDLIFGKYYKKSIRMREIISKNKR